ncbi:MAG: WG repeat-containing protein [Clostridia bacterium]|nr:WG repeat-containing protein [Clostridia bacterium]
MATRNGQAGVVKNGKVIINYAYQSVEYDDYNHVFILQRSSKIGVADSEGTEIVPVEYEEINVKGIYLQAIGFEGETTYFDASGNKIEDNKYESVLRTENSNYLITIDSDGMYGITNSQGQVILENTYRYLEYLFEDYFIASNEKGYLGIINNLGNILVDFQYEVLQKVDNTNVIEAKILKENKTDLYSSKLEKIDTKVNASIYSYDNYIEVYSQDKVVYYDVQGKQLTNTQVHSGILYAKEENGKWGLVDSEDNVVVDFIYDRTTSLNEHGFAGIKKDGKWGVVDKSGNIIKEPVYKLENENKDPEFIGIYYRVYYGYGESYYTNEIKDE